VADDLVIVARSGPITHLVLNRPDSGNALNGPLSAAFAEAVYDAIADDGRAIVITAQGERFCVGGDLKFFIESDDPSGYLLRGVTALEKALEGLRLARKPVVFGVHGAVAGAGLGMMLSGDLVIAGSSTVFSTAYTRVGLTPDCGLSWLLPRSIGHHRAMDLMLTSRAVSASVAEEWGLVSRVVPGDEVTQAALSVAARIVSNPELSLAESKRLVTESWNRCRSTSGEDEARTIARAVTTADTVAAIGRFLAP
jgi:2-(1,2-epoxy-1,2-dihydrophenyl)acetyl-CoA isomerase